MSIFYRNTHHKRILIGICVSTLLLSACEKKKESPFPKGNPLVWSESATPRYQPLEREDTILFEAPHLSNNSIVVSGFDDSETLSKQVSIKVERSWETPTTNNFIVSIKNNSSKGTRATFYLFRHDEMGRLVSTESKDIFFKAYESVFREYKEDKKNGISSWSLAVK